MIKLTCEQHFFSLNICVEYFPWKLSNFQDPPPPCPTTSKILPPVPLTLDIQFQANHPSPPPPPLPPLPPPPPLPPSPNDNQSIKRKHNPRWLLYVIRSFLQVVFCFQYQLINLVWLSIDFFSFSWNQSCPQSNFKKLKTSFFAFHLQREDALGSRLSWSLTIYFFVVLYSCVHLSKKVYLVIIFQWSCFLHKLKA